MMGAKDKRVDSGHLNVRLLRAKKDIESLIGQSHFILNPIFSFGSWHQEKRKMKFLKNLNSPTLIFGHFLGCKLF